MREVPHVGGNEERLLPRRRPLQERSRKRLDAILDAEKRTKDAGYRARLETQPTPRLLDHVRAAKKGTAVAAKPVEKAPAKKAAAAKPAAAKKAPAKKAAKA